MLKDIKRRGVIEESVNTGHPLRSRRKYKSDFCFCVIYRILNDVTRKVCFPLPRIDNNLDMLAQAECFSALDLKSGFWQVNLYPDDK
jgi:hypothetical protein